MAEFQKYLDGITNGKSADAEEYYDEEAEYDNEKAEYDEEQ